MAIITFFSAHGLLSALQDSLTEKLISDPEQKKDWTREPRGATKEQWAKQPYIVRKNDDDDELTLSDNFHSPTENVRAPRVQFVTHSLIDTPSSNNLQHERERGGRKWDDDVAPRNLARDLSPEMNYYHPRYMRNYAPTPYRYR